MSAWFRRGGSGRLSALVALMLLSLSSWWCFGETLPSDERLREQFARSRRDLERLREMVDEDGLDSRIHADYVDDKQLSSDRVAEYRRLLRRTGVDRLWAHGLAEPIEFTVGATGFLDVGTYKGFYYSDQEEGPIADSLDESCMSLATKAEFCCAVRHLDGNWWLIRYEYHG